MTFFCEKINFSCKWFTPKNNLNDSEIEVFLFNIHLALGISYYKAYPTKNLIFTEGCNESFDPEK